jgi:hypothetical protein
MRKLKQGVNPFYVLLLAVGVLFLVTASAFFVMTLRASQAQSVVEAGPDHPLMALMQRHGVRLMLAEAAVLLVATVLAMATDRYWIRRAEREKKSE